MVLVHDIFDRGFVRKIVDSQLLVTLTRGRISPAKKKPKKPHLSSFWWVRHLQSSQALWTCGRKASVMRSCMPLCLGFRIFAQHTLHMPWLKCLLSKIISYCALCVCLYFLQRATHGNSGRQGSVKSEGANSMSQPVVGAAAADEGYGLAGRNQMYWQLAQVAARCKTSGFFSGYIPCVVHPCLTYARMPAHK